MVFILIWVVSFIAGGITRGLAGFVWGFFLGPIGLLLAIAIHDDPKLKQQKEINRARRQHLKRCQYCDELIRRNAVVCKHCKRELEQIEESECPVCHSEVHITDDKCPECDYKLRYFELD